MSKNKIYEQKKLMGIVEQDLFNVPQVPITVNQKITEMKIQAENVFHSSEIAARSFKKISHRLNDLENKAAESFDVLMAEAKTLINLIRMGIEDIDSAQARANELLKSLDYIISGSYNNSMGV